MKNVLLLLSIIISNPLGGQIDTSLAELIKEHTYALKISDQTFDEGVAKQRLLDAISESQFVLIGEQHGIREVGTFTKHIYAQSQGHGFRHLALEVSPFMAQTIEEKVKEGRESLIAFDKKLPFSIPFYNNRSDLPMLESSLAQAASDIWGLDQVFMVEPRSLFAKLIEIAPTQEAKELAEGYLRIANEKIGAAMQSGKFDEIILFQLGEKDYEKLHTAYPKDDNILADEIIQQIQKTRDIYQAWSDGRNYDNNYERVQLMKNNFYQYYHNAVVQGELIPKVVFKFGSNHMQRGITPVNVFDLGNMASELAIQNELESTHILINAIKGVSFHPLRGSQPFDHWEDLDAHIQFALEERRTDDNWILIDLRPLRQMRLKHTDADLKRIIFGFDFWVVVPEAEAIEAF